MVLLLASVTILGFSVVFSYDILLVFVSFLGFSVVDAYDRYKRKMAKKHD